jgi:hypothetical protein
MMMSSLLWVTACSDVKFAPEAAAPTQQSQKDPTVTSPPPPPPPPPAADKTLTEDFVANDDSQAKVDILFIVDNSYSMTDSQRKLGDRLENFITSLGQIDWQIGVTTTDVSSDKWGIKGSLVPFAGLGSNILTKDAPNFIEEFKSNVVREESVGCNPFTCPSSDERPLQALVGAIAKRNSDNKGFFRDAADLAVVVLSDEDEASHGGSTALKPAAAMAAFAAAFGVQKSLTAYGLLVQPGDDACKAQQGSDGAFGTFVSLLAQLSGGETGSICAEDYSDTLKSIGKRIREISVAYELSQTPNPGTVAVVLSPMDTSVSWSVSGKTVKFNKAPAKGTRIKITYLPK